MQDKKPLIYGIVAAVAAIPYVFVEYRRIVSEQFDLIYWLCSALLLVSIFCIYKLLIPRFMANYENMSEEDREKKNLDPFGVRCNCASIGFFAVAVFALIVSGVIWLIK